MMLTHAAANLLIVAADRADRFRRADSLIDMRNAFGMDEKDFAKMVAKIRFPSKR